MSSGASGCLNELQRISKTTTKKRTKTSLRLKRTMKKEIGRKARTAKATTGLGMHDKELKSFRLQFISLNCVCIVFRSSFSSLNTLQAGILVTRSALRRVHLGGNKVLSHPC